MIDLFSNLQSVFLGTMTNYSTSADHIESSNISSDISLELSLELEGIFINNNEEDQNDMVSNGSDSVYEEDDQESKDPEDNFLEDCETSSRRYFNEEYLQTLIHPQINITKRNVLNMVLALLSRH